MRRTRIRAMAVTAGAVALLAGAGAVPFAAAAVSHSAGAGSGKQPSPIKHVLLLTVDGMHQQDLEWYVNQYPDSVLADLVRDGVGYSNAVTTIPSDSFPATVGLMTGGSPGVTGFYYDDTYNYDVFPAGTKKCVGPPPGAPVNYDNSIDVNTNKLDAGQGLKGLPGSILQMTSNLRSVINPAYLPVSAATCQPIYPNQYLKVNTIFNVVRNAGLRTAWSDKHPSYLVLSGPSGNGVEDFFAPEISSQAIGYPAGVTWDADVDATMKFDSYRVQAVLNEIDGYNHSRSEHVGVPALFGMNFQSVTTAEQLPTSDGLTAGYLPGGKVPAPALLDALNYVDTEIGAMVTQIKAQGLASSTAIIITSKQGQSPTDPDDFKRINDAPIVAAVDAAWAKVHPHTAPLVVSTSDDDVLMWWLSNRSQAAANFVRNYLLSHTAVGYSIHGKKMILPASGLKTLYAGAASAAYFGVPASDPRHPVIFGIVQHGVIYADSPDIAQHGGGDFQDVSIPILVVLPGQQHGTTNGTHVSILQIAPTILALLGLNPRELQAVQIEHTQVLPGLSIRQT
jgi:Type I phosphodiesterase / nucleotide pyrophosphatase